MIDKYELFWMAISPIWLLMVSAYICKHHHFILNSATKNDQLLPFVDIPSAYAKSVCWDFTNYLCYLFSILWELIVV